MQFSEQDEVRDESTRWLYDYNHDQPHLALDRQTPAGYRVRREADRDRLAEPSGRGCASPSSLSQAEEPLMAC